MGFKLSPALESYLKVQALWFIWCVAWWFALVLMGGCLCCTLQL